MESTVFLDSELSFGYGQEGSGAYAPRIILIILGHPLTELQRALT